MTLTFERDLDKGEVNQHAVYLQGGPKKRTPELFLL